MFKPLNYLYLYSIPYLILSPHPHPQLSSLGTILGNLILILGNLYTSYL